MPPTRSPVEPEQKLHEYGKEKSPQAGIPSNLWAFCLFFGSINLADSTGRWIGNGWGSIYQSAVFIKSVRPLYPANYTFKIMNGMKDEKLSGINDIGIRIERQEN